MASNDIIKIGDDEWATYQFTEKTIESISCNNSVDLIGNELSSDTLEVSLICSEEGLMRLPYATQVSYFVGEQKVGEYYLTRVERTGVYRYKLSATSIIGLIDKERFYGGMYSATPFDTALRQILFEDGLSPRYDLREMMPRINYSVGILATSVEANEGYWNATVKIKFTVSSDQSGITTDTVDVFGEQFLFSTRIHRVLDSESGAYYWDIMPLYANDLGYASNDSNYLMKRPMFGDGTTFEVEMNGSTRKYRVIARYKKYDDPSVSGTWYFWGNLKNLPLYEPIQLGYVFCSCHKNEYQTSYSRDGYGANIAIDYYKVYDENGAYIINEFFGKRIADNALCAVNAVNGNVITLNSNYYSIYGDSEGVVGDPSQIDMFRLLSGKINYAPGVDTLPVYGWIPVCTRREALHNLLFSQNISIIKADTTSILFTRISDSVVGEIDSGSLYDTGSVSDEGRAKTISVTEHGYSNVGLSSAVVFDNTGAQSSGDSYIVLFQNAPIYGTPVGNGITISPYYNCNAAIVTGVGKITATPYLHSQNVLEYKGDYAYEGVDIDVSNVGLITNVNSDGIMEKLKSYYIGGLKSVKNSVVYNGERAGLKYRFPSLFGGNESGHLVKMTSNSSTFVKSDCEFIVGYDAGGGSYTNNVVITWGETWEVPDEVRTSAVHSIRIAIIGAGKDGTDGQDGDRGETIYSSISGAAEGSSGGAGGAGGVGGEGGRILSFTMDVTDVHRIVANAYHYGGETDTSVRTYSDGGTVNGTYNSRDGQTQQYGYMNLFTGEVFGMKGYDGVAGASGGKGGWTDSNRNMHVGGSGGSVGSKSGGTSFRGISTSYSSAWGPCQEYHSYGGGGGASATGVGGNSTSQSWSTGIYTTGGKGADGGAPINVRASYGCGGSGGNGGGGGGGAGTRYICFYGQYGMEYSTQYFAVGTGGVGSQGTAGKDGCVVIYY